MPDQETLTYENILGRTPRVIEFTPGQLAFLKSQKIMITGAGGSIGSRISIALEKLGNTQVLCTDRDESALHSLSLEMNSSA